MKSDGYPRALYLTTSIDGIATVAQDRVTFTSGIATLIANILVRAVWHGFKKPRFLGLKNLKSPTLGFLGLKK